MSVDRCALKSITNSFQDVRLVSLCEWRNAPQIIPCDHGGPYMVGQEGYDPQDPNYEPNEFVLGKSGRWIPLADYFKLAADIRVKEFMFGTAAEVVNLMENLPSQVVMWEEKTEPKPPLSGGDPEPEHKQAYAAAVKTPLAR